MIPFDASGAFRSVAEGSELRRLTVQARQLWYPPKGLGSRSRWSARSSLARLLTAADFGVVAMVATFSLLLMSFPQMAFMRLSLTQTGQKG